VKRPARSRAALLLAALLSLPAALSADGERPPALRLDVHAFQVLEQYSGPYSYYRIIEDPAEPFVRALYRPGTEPVTVGLDIPDGWRRGTRKLRWRWRAMALPKGADECDPDKSDSAASVTLTWKSGFRYYSVKYAWTTLGARGRVCDSHRGFFIVRDTKVARAGGPVGEWFDEEVDPDAEFRKQFRDGDPGADVPDLVALSLRSDGDETRSVSGADFTAFALLR
jgi:hypothetical protein